MRIIRLLLLLFALLTCTAIFLRNVGLEKLTPLLLSRLGLEQVECVLNQVDHNTLSIKTLSFTLRQSSGPLSIRFNDAVCRYRLSDLLRGRVSACTVQSIDMTLPQFTGESGAATGEQLPRLAEWARFLAPQHMPLDHLELQHLNLHYAGAQPTQAAPFSVRYRNEAAERRLFLRSPESGDAPALRLELRHGDEGVNGTLDLDFSRSRTLLPASMAAAMPSTGTARVQLQQAPSTPLQVHLALSGVETSGLRIGEAALMLQSNGSPSLTEVQLSPASQLRISDLHSGRTSLRSFSLNLGGSLHFSEDRWRYRLASADPCRLDGLVAGKSRFSSLRLDRLDLDASLASERLQLDATLSTPLGQGILELDCSHQRDQTGKGACRLTSRTPLLLTAERNPLTLLADPPKMEITRGQLALNLTSQWQNARPLELLAEVDATVEQGSFFEIPFLGCTLQQKLQVLPHLQSTTSGSLKFAQIKGPVPMEQVQLVTRIDSRKKSNHSVVTLIKAGAELLQGRLDLEKCTYALDGSPTTCGLRLNGIDLEPLIALHQVEGLHVNGRLRGQLPLHFSSQGLRITRGVLENEGRGGIIRYQPPAGTMQQSPLTAYALAALRDLHYQHLAAQVDYQPDGTLAVDLQIQGNNPTLDKGRAVHLNLNTEQNLLSLLKSVQYSQSLSSELGRKLMHAPTPKNNH